MNIKHNRILKQQTKRIQKGESKRKVGHVHAVKPLVKVDGVLASDDVLSTADFLCVTFSHPKKLHKHNEQHDQENDPENID